MEIINQQSRAQMRCLEVRDVGMYTEKSLRMEREKFMQGGEWLTNGIQKY